MITSSKYRYPYRHRQVFILFMVVHNKMIIWNYVAFLFLFEIAIIYYIGTNNFYLPKDDNALLIFVASFNLSPVAPVFDWRSLPAKSTKFNFPTFIDFDWPSTISITIYIRKWCMIAIKIMSGSNRRCLTWNIAWDLELCSFIFVAPVVRFTFPIFIAFNMSLALWQLWECRFVTTTPSPGISLSSWLFVLFTFNKSLNKINV